MGLCLYDNLSLSITRMWGEGYLEWHRMGWLLRGIALSYLFYHLRLTVNVSSKFMPSRAGTPPLDFPQIKTVFIAFFFMCIYSISHSNSTGKYVTR